jgi:hypothetical protein
MTSDVEGIIYNYKVDFTEAGGTGAMETADETMSSSTSAFGLDTYLKFKIMNQQAEELKRIFMLYVFVGTNLFSTTLINKPTALSRMSTLGNRSFSVYIEQVSYFSLNELLTMKMEDHPVALSFINMVIK